MVARTTDRLTPKQSVYELLRRLPETATLEEIAAEFALLAALRKGEEDADAGRLVSHDEAMRRSAEWLPK